MIKINKIKLISITTAMTILLSATAVFADTTSSYTVQDPKFSQTQSAEINCLFKSQLDGLVTSGTLNQTQEDVVQSASLTASKGGATKDNFKGGDNVEFNTVLDDLVKSGTITQNQENAIQNAILISPKVSAAKGKLKRGDNGGFKTVLIGLVKADTLTQTQVGVIQNAIAAPPLVTTPVTPKQSK